ncbi:MAG: hypothetical protein Q4B54_03480 [Coriobacteriales bacterium]|nr:hypothetical protein [Coriobacteriales bacterium]
MSSESYSPKHMAPEPRQPQERPSETVSQPTPEPEPQAAPRVSRPLALAFVGLCLVAMIVPLALTPLSSRGASAENRTLAAMPALSTETGPNLEFLSQLGAWYADHFGLRSELIDLDSSIKESLFGTSSTDNVVVGSKGWLYYAGELNDWRQMTPLSERGVKNAARNLSLVQEVVRSQGKGFVVAIAPNKSSLYPEHMPAWQLAAKGESNASRLAAELARQGVNYVDLFGVLRAQNRELYLLKDSHWTNEGALLAANALLDALGHPHVDWLSEQPVSDSSLKGDLNAMLHPVTASGETQPLWQSAQAFSFESEATNVEEASLDTSSAAAGGLLMMRDSFGNALLPYMASSYGHAHFSKLMPYDLGNAALSKADDVVIVRAERHLSSFATMPPYLAAPERTLAENLPTRDLVAEQGSSSGTVSVSKNGPYLQVEGVLDPQLFAASADSHILVSLRAADGTMHTFEAFCVSTDSDAYADTEAQASSGGEESILSLPDAEDYGYRAYVSLGTYADWTPAHLSVLVADDVSVTTVVNVSLV